MLASVLILLYQKLFIVDCELENSRMLIEWLINEYRLACDLNLLERKICMQSNNIVDIGGAKATQNSCETLEAVSKLLQRDKVRNN